MLKFFSYVRKPPHSTLPPPGRGSRERPIGTNFAAGAPLRFAPRRRMQHHRVFSNISRPISMRRISLVPAPIS
jgi:hypothetical protein